MFFVLESLRKGSKAKVCRWLWIMKGTFYENNRIPDKSGGLRKTKQEENKYCKRVKRTQVILYPQPETYAI